METLVDFLGVAGQRPRLPIVVCCTSRDELDAVCSALSNLPTISLSSLYSDQADKERASVLEGFKLATARWNQLLKATDEAVNANDDEKVCLKSHVIVVTDVCLPILSSWESSLTARVLINYELPAKKETYSRRLTACLAADGIVINMVVGGEVMILKAIEEWSGIDMAEMPISISEIL